MGLTVAKAWAPDGGRTGDRTVALRRLAALSGGAILAEAAIYALGVPWLALATGLDLREAVAVGVVPFLLGDLLKTGVAIGAIRTGRGVLARRGALPLL